MTTYYLYKIENNINGKIYIGAHATNKDSDTYLNDGWLKGKGSQLKGVSKWQ